MAYWLLKTETEQYSYGSLEREGRTTWNGVRSPVALRWMRKMAQGDLAFIYHSGKERAIIGIAEVAREAYPEAGTGFPVVDLVPRERLTRAVSLAEVKSRPEFAGWELVRQPRLSVIPVRPEHWDAIIMMSRG